ncbi:MAG: fibrobacter succinogenes major paralogous domain-containing protein [Fibrobacter sp.]|nr:fibrobacter succinogenes major paralogous domain-containing protein [Fibrobacter sp.]
MKKAYMVFTEASIPQLFIDAMYHTYKNNGLSVRCVKD